jgi:hypothetical protein
MLDNPPPLLVEQGATMAAGALRMIETAVTIED